MHDLFNVPNNFFNFRYLFGLGPSKRQLRHAYEKAEQQKQQQEVELLKPWHIKLFQTMAIAYEQSDPKQICAPEGVRVGLIPGETVSICYSDGNRLCEIHHKYSRRWFKLYPTNTYTVTIDEDVPELGEYYQEYSDPELVRYLQVLFDLFRYGDKISPEQKQTLLDLKGVKATLELTRKAESINCTIDYLGGLYVNKNRV